MGVGNTGKMADTENRPPGPPKGETHRYTQILVDTTGMKPFNVSRNAFDPNAFVMKNSLKVISSNFFNVTGV